MTGERSMLEAFEQSREWYLAKWPFTRKLFPRIDRLVAQGRLVKPADAGDGWYAYPDGERVHIVMLRPMLDGWSPETLQGAELIGNLASDGNFAADAKWRNLAKQARSSKAGAGNLENNNRARAGNAADRLDLLRRFHQRGDSAAMLRCRIAHMTGEVLNVSDRQLRRDLEKIEIRRTH